MTAYEMAATVEFSVEAKQQLLEARSETARLEQLLRLLRSAVRKLDTWNARRRGRDPTARSGSARARPPAGRHRVDGARGQFWDAMEGRVPPPPAAVTLGWELVSIDPDAGTIEVTFRATEAFLNPMGNVQGGFLAAMLDDTLGPALMRDARARASGRRRPICTSSSSDPSQPGVLRGRGRVVRRGRTTGVPGGRAAR